MSGKQASCEMVKAHCDHDKFGKRIKAHRFPEIHRTPGIRNPKDVFRVPQKPPENTLKAIHLGTIKLYGGRQRAK